MSSIGDLRAARHLDGHDAPRTLVERHADGFGETTTQEMSRGRSQPVRNVVLAAWAVTASFLMLPFLTGVPQRYRELVDPCGSDCDRRVLGQLDAPQRAQLFEIGIDPRIYAWWDIGREAALAIVGVVLGTVLIRRVGTLIALLTATVMVSFGAVLVPEVSIAGERAGVLPGLVQHSVWVVAMLTIVVPWYLLPTGRFTPRWMWAPATATVVSWIVMLFSDGADGPPVALQVVALGLLVFGVGAQVHRYREATDDVERQQLKWLAIGLFGWLMSLLVYSTFVDGGLLDPESTGLSYPLTYLAYGVVVTAAAAVFPFAWSVAILQHRLWDADRVLSRGALVVLATGGIVATYLLAVFVVAAVADQHTEVAGPVAAATLVGLTLWVRDPLTRKITRLFYGQRDAPYELLTSLWATANQRRPDEATLTLLTRRLVESLHLSAGRIVVTGDTGVLLDEVVGEPHASAAEVVLESGGEAVGTLWVWPRPGETAVADRDVRLVAVVSAPLAHLASTVRLTGDLRRSRVELVNAREEERRRIHRDLHDDLGPTLAGQVLLLDAAAATADSDPVRTREFLGRARHRADELVDHVRRISQDLRPSALDQLGLGPSLRRAVSAADSANIRVISDIDDVPGLSAAVETAMYRIVTEALTNALRHSGASSIDVRLGADRDDLVASIVDDGCGATLNTPTTSRTGGVGEVVRGVGLRSMHARARELGGEVRITSEAGCGTVVEVRIPLGADG